MDITRRGDLIEIDGRVRVEPARPRRREIATEELLSNEVTASHYAVGLPDALGNIIALGEPFDFIDYMADRRVYHVYRLTEVEDEVNGAKIKNNRFLHVGDPHDTEEAALSHACTIAAAWPAN